MLPGRFGAYPTAVDEARLLGAQSSSPPPSSTEPGSESSLPTGLRAWPSPDMILRLDCMGHPGFVVQPARLGLPGWVFPHHTGKGRPGAVWRRRTEVELFL